MGDLEFAAWAQTRLGRAAEATDTMGELRAAEFRPAVSVSGPRPFEAVGPVLRLLGPGGVVGFDPGAILRTDPPDGATEVEDNYLASIDFRTPELPWVLTPAHAGPDQRLRPWIVLVVVEAAAVDRRPLPVVEVHTDQLPDLRDSWAWAHVQLPSRDATPPPGLEHLVGQKLSRLVCPRRLAPGKQYRACVVPAFAGGVAAGLGQTGSATESHAPAWRVDQLGPITLPLYYTWTFSTSEQGGDFKDLVSRLEPADLSALAGFGARTVDVSEPWRTDPPLLDDRPPDERGTPQTVAVQGALRPIGRPPPGTATPAALADLADRLRGQLEAPAARLEAGGPRGDTVAAVAPPLYGGRHMNRTRVMTSPADGDPPVADWVTTLNLGAPSRIAAGLGAEYVRADQEDLMARAWEQVGAVREANRLRSVAELATEVANSVHRRHVASLTAGELVGFSAPAATRTRTAGGATLAVEVAVSPLPDAAASTAFARLLRPSGAVARATRTGLDSIVAGGLRGSLRGSDSRPVLARLEVNDREPVGTDLATATAAARTAVDSTAVARQLLVSKAVADVARVNGFGPAAAMVGATVESIGVDSATLVQADIGAIRTALVPRLAEAARTMTDMMGRDFGPAAPGGRVVSTLGVQIEPGDLRMRLVAALRPGDRIARRLDSRLTIPPRLQPRGFDPVMAYPTFPVPTALALLATDKEWFLPGAGIFPANRVTVLQSNGVFIQSYLAGMNHEMMRELRWREYPTDQRGTPFRRFWPRPDGLPDVPPMDTWRAPLGDVLELGDRGIAVLLVRGDVVRRFRDVVVAAAPAVTDPPPAGRIVPNPDPETWQTPLFVVPLDESTFAYAFNVEPDELMRTGATGWFFVFQEHGYRIRFGFDRVHGPGFKTWDVLGWPKVPTDGRGFALAAGPIEARPVDARGAAWGTDAADMARIVLQRPFRVAIHASALVKGQG